ncbi:MAG: class I SAM-dependent methyltransferase [Planctomycetes bacterium]|nr:class I SAM-dependent methyltransferase [Planctomycetota bacterium]
MSCADDHDTESHAAEAAFWDMHEQRLPSLYARPHDWRLVPRLAESLLRPRHRFMRRVMRRHAADVGTLLDVGCGNGWFCHAAARAGIHAIGVDVSEVKIEAARRLAREQGVESSCEFHVRDIAEFSPPSPVDLIVSLGSLHHLPDLEHVLPAILERTLRRGGLVLLCEPHHEGMAPWLEKFVTWFANFRGGAYFDTDLYARATSGDAATDVNVRGESPAGREFFGTQVAMADVVRTLGLEALEVRFFFYAAGHLANIGYVYMRLRLVRALTRLASPLLAELDAMLCRWPRIARHAGEAVWTGRWCGPSDRRDG